MVNFKEYARAHVYYNRALNLVKSLPENRFLGEIYYLKGIAYKKDGKLKEALKMFLEANRIFETIGNLLYLDKIEKEIAITNLN